MSGSLKNMERPRATSANKKAAEVRLQNKPDLALQAELPQPAFLADEAADTHEDTRTYDDEVSRSGQFALVPTSHAVDILPVAGNIRIRDTVLYPERLGLARISRPLQKFVQIIIMPTASTLPVWGTLTLLSLCMPGSVGGPMAEQIWKGLWIFNFYVCAVEFPLRLFNFGHPEVVKLILSHNWTQVLKLNGFRLIYNICFGIMCPNPVNISQLACYQGLVLLFSFYDAVLVTTRLRFPRLVYQKSNDPVALGFSWWLLALAYMLCLALDVGRHFTFLYLYQLQQDAAQTTQAQSLASLTVMGRSMDISPKVVANAVYTAFCFYKFKFVFTAVRNKGFGQVMEITSDYRIFSRD